MKSPNKIKAFDLFSGIGGFRHGLNDCLGSSNFDWIGRSDIDKYANILYDNYYKTKNEILIEDITDVTGNLNPNKMDSKITLSDIDLKIPDFDLLTAGFPCQAFSSMGKRKGFGDPRGTLFFAIYLILKSKMPKKFILENVRGLLTIDNKNTINSMKNLLSKLGYNIEIFLLNASDFGVPQTRRRVFIVGSLNGFNNNSDLPKKILRKKFKTSWHLLEKKVDQKYYLSEKIKKTILSEGSGGYKYKADYNLLIGRPLTYTMHKMHRASQDNYYSDSFINGIFNNKENIVIENSKGKNNIRRITPIEALRFQGFNERFINKALSLGLSDTRLYMLAGNSVPTTLVKAVGKWLYC